MKVFHNAYAILFVICFLSLNISAQTFSIQNTINCTNCIDVYVEGYLNIVSAQGSITFDPSIFSVDYIDSDYYSASDFNIGTVGALVYAHLDAMLVGENFGDVILFTVCFNEISSGTSAIDFSNTPTALEVTDNNFSIIPSIIYNNGTLSTAGSNCFLVVPPGNIPSGIYQNNVGVVSNSCVPDGNEVIFLSIGYIQLDGGFCVEIGGNFTAENN